MVSLNGFPQDIEMLSKIPGIDICLSAHTHNRLYEAVKINNAILIQYGCHGSFVGHLKVDGQKRKIIDYNYRLITVKQDIIADAEVTEIVKRIVLPYKAMQKEQVGKTEIILHRYSTLEASMDNLLFFSLVVMIVIHIYNFIYETGKKLMILPNTQ
ncbi:MAG: hypothetical protein NVS1B13_10040 [Flavisolibacter sp.]